MIRVISHNQCLVLNSMSANVIMISKNSSINKLFLHFRHVVSWLNFANKNMIYKATAELSCVSEHFELID